MQIGMHRLGLASHICLRLVLIQSKEVSYVKSWAIILVKRYAMILNVLVCREATLIIWAWIKVSLLSLPAHCDGRDFSRVTTIVALRVEVLDFSWCNKQLFSSRKVYRGDCLIAIAGRIELMRCREWGLNVKRETGTCAICSYSAHRAVLCNRTRWVADICCISLVITLFLRMGSFARNEEIRPDLAINKIVCQGKKLVRDWSRVYACLG